MFKALQLITTVRENGHETSYLYEKTEKIILPITQNSRLEKSETYSSIYRIIQALNSHILCIKIYLHNNDRYYTYLTLFRHLENIDINIDINTALDLAKNYSIPIFIKNSILYENGFNVTKEMVEEALNNY